MPIPVHVDATARLVVATLYRRVTVVHPRANEAALAADPAFEPTFTELLAIGAVELADIGLDRPGDMARASAFRSGAWRAVVAAAKATFDPASMMRSLHERGPGISPFHDRVAAGAWLREEPCARLSGGR